MTDIFLLKAICVALLLVVGVVLLLIELTRREDRVKERIRLVQGRTAAAPRTNRFEGALAAVRHMGMFIIQSGILSRKSISDLEQSLVASGRRPATALPLVVGNKVALMIALPIIGWLLAGSLGVGGSAARWTAAALGASVGLMLPDIVVGWFRGRYLAQVERGLPDALDLLVICADAGLPLETALDRVALEFRESDPPTANELSLTAHEMKILPDRRLALVNLGVRTGLEFADRPRRHAGANPAIRHPTDTGPANPVRRNAHHHAGAFRREGRAAAGSPDPADDALLPALRHHRRARPHRGSGVSPDARVAVMPSRGLRSARRLVRNRSGSHHHGIRDHRAGAALPDHLPGGRIDPINDGCRIAIRLAGGRAFRCHRAGLSAKHGANPPASREAAIAQIITAVGAGLINQANLTVTLKYYPSFSAIGGVARWNQRGRRSRCHSPVSGELFPALAVLRFGLSAGGW